MLELRQMFKLWFKTSNRSWPDDVWEEFIFDQFAYFSMAFDYNHRCRRKYDKKPKKSFPEFLDYPCNVARSDSDLFLL